MLWSELCAAEQRASNIRLTPNHRRMEILDYWDEDEKQPVGIQPADPSHVGDPNEDDLRIAKRYRDQVADSRGRYHYTQAIESAPLSDREWQQRQIQLARNKELEAKATAYHRSLTERAARLRRSS